MIPRNGMLPVIKLKKALVWPSVCKKQSMQLLTLDILKTSAPEDSINLPSRLLMVPRWFANSLEREFVFRRCN
jgi:hypothetical protein